MNSTPLSRRLILAATVAMNFIWIGQAQSPIDSHVPFHIGSGGPLSVPDDSGGIIVGWNVGDYEVRIQRVDADGTLRWGPAGRIVAPLDSVEGPGAHWFSWLWSAGNGESFIALVGEEWLGNVLGVKKIDRNGLELFPPGGVVLGETGLHIGGAISGVVDDFKGGCWAVVSYRDYSPHAEHSSVVLKHVAANGTVSPGPEFHGDSFWFTSVISDGSGGLIACWLEQTHVNDSVGPVSTTIIHVSDTGEVDTILSSQTFLPYPTRIAPDGSGGFFLFGNGSLSGELKAQRIVPDVDGWNIAWGPAGVLLADSWDETNGWSPLDLCADGAGGMCIAWNDVRSGTRNIHAQRLSGEGSLLWTPGGVGAGLVQMPQHDPRVAPDGTGGLIVTWWEQLPKGVGDPGVFAQRIDGTGARRWDDPGMAVAEGLRPQIAPRGEARAMILWNVTSETLGDTGSDIFGAIVDSSGIPPCHDIVVRDGWNLLSVPGYRNPMSLNTIFPSASSSAYWYSGDGYLAETELTPERGYWVRFESEDTIRICGTSFTQSRIGVHQGWNMVAAPFDVVTPVDAITTDPPGLIGSDFYRFEMEGYESVEYLEPGRGYWVISTGYGHLQFPAGSSRRR